jgi:hypothetical protein
MLDSMSLGGSCSPGCLRWLIEDVRDEDGLAVVRARTRNAAVACPGCGAETARVHGYHERTAADVPAGGRRVVVRL